MICEMRNIILIPYFSAILFFSANYFYTKFYHINLIPSILLSHAQSIRELNPTRRNQRISHVENLTLSFLCMYLFSTLTQTLSLFSIFTKFYMWNFLNFRTALFLCISYFSALTKHFVYFPFLLNFTMRSFLMRRIHHVPFLCILHLIFPKLYPLPPPFIRLPIHIPTYDNMTHANPLTFGHVAVKWTYL